MLKGGGRQLGPLIEEAVAGDEGRDFQAMNYLFWWVVQSTVK
jgi:hypothetical protein